MVEQQRPLAPASNDQIVEEALAIANAVQACVAGHRATSMSLALGWVVGAVAAQGTRGQPDLDELLWNVSKQAQVKFDGVRDGTWPDGSCVPGGN